MAFGGNCGFTCESHCPPEMVDVQPPPICITIPGPIIECYTQPSMVSHDNPCGYGCGGYGGWDGYGSYGGYGGYGDGWGVYGGYGRGWGGYGGCGGFGGFKTRCTGGYGVCGW